jgi:hypothetical protein
MIYFITFKIISVTMKFYKINLALSAVLLICLFFMIAAYNHWLWTNIFNPDTDITEQMQHLDVNDRMATRFGATYLYYKKLTATFGNLHKEKVIVLLPPNELLKQQKIKDFHSPEPCEFYYFTGYEAVWANSPHAENANCYVYPRDHKIFLGKVNSQAQLDTVINYYKKYKPSL